MVSGPGVLFALLAVAAAPEVPIDLQAAVFTKALRYDRTISESGKTALALVVAAADPTDARARRLAEAFRQLGLTVRVAGPGELEGARGDAVAVYVFAGGPVDEVARVCRANRLLSLTGHVPWVEGGQVAVGLEVSDAGKAKIVIHRQRLEAEGHRFPATLLTIARIVGGE